MYHNFQEMALKRRKSNVLKQILKQRAAIKRKKLFSWSCYGVRKQKRKVILVSMCTHVTPVREASNNIETCLKLGMSCLELVYVEHERPNQI